MSECLLNHLGVGADREHQGGAGVPEFVEAYVGQSGSPEERLEVAGHEVRVVGVSAKGVREDQPTIVAGAVRPRPLRVLEPSVPEERIHGGVGEVHAS